MPDRPPRIGAIHALAGSVGPTDDAFARVWPGAEVVHLLDGSLYLDRSRGTADDTELAARIAGLIGYSAATGADGIVVTGSFFGDQVVAARATVDIPVARSFDGIVTRALELGLPIQVLSTAPDSMTLLRDELARESTRRHSGASVGSGAVAPGALDALVQGDVARHDRLVLDAVAATAAEAAIVFAQFSMERVLDRAAAGRARPVLGPATAAAARLRQQLTRR